MSRKDLGKVTAVKSRLRALAYTRGPGAKLPTFRELREDIGTTAATLSSALDYLEAESVIERKHAVGIYVSLKLHCKHIRVLINASLVGMSGVSPFWGVLWGQIVAEGQRRAAYKNEDLHFQLIPCDSHIDSLPTDVVRLIEHGPLDGILSIGMPQVIWKVPKTVPMVSFAGAGHWLVSSRSEGVIAEAAGRLAALGCRKIGYWVPYGYVHREELIERFAGADTAAFQSGLRSHGVAYHPELHYVRTMAASDIERGGISVETCFIGGSYPEQGSQAVYRAFGDSSPMRPDGLVIADDMMTCGALSAMRKLGLRPGHDVKIATHSNVGLPILYGWEDEILMWQIDPAEIVTTLFTQLDRLMAGEDVEQFAYVDQRFPD